MPKNKRVKTADDKSDTEESDRESTWSFGPFKTAARCVNCRRSIPKEVSRFLYGTRSTCVKCNHDANAVVANVMQSAAGAAPTAPVAPKTTGVTRKKPIASAPPTKPRFLQGHR